MSDDVTTVETDETPPPDIVEQPARSRGAYKLCMECGQNVLRPHYRAGSSVCKACEAKGSTPVEALEVPAGNEAPVPLDAAAEALVTVHGSSQALDWLEGICNARGATRVTLDQIAATLGELHAQQAQMIGRVTRYGAVAEAVRPDEVPLEVAAEALYLACDPILQEKLRAAMEVLRLSLNQVILGNLAYHEQELLNQDQSLVPQASYAAQYGTGVGGRGAAGRASMPGRPLVDAQGQLIKDCLCCGREFHPTPQRPNPDFCDEACGTFVDQLRIWATNMVLNELRYPGATDATPAPDPRPYWPVERCQEPFLSTALQFRERRGAQQMAAAREQQQKMRGL